VVGSENEIGREDDGGEVENENESGCRSGSETPCESESGWGRASGKRGSGCVDGASE